MSNDFRAVFITEKKRTKEKNVKTDKNVKSHGLPPSGQLSNASGSKWCSICRKDNHNTEDCFTNVQKGKGGKKSGGKGKSKGKK